MALSKGASIVLLVLAFFIAMDVVVERVQGQLNTCVVAGPNYLFLCSFLCPPFCNARFLNGTNFCSGGFFFKRCFCTFTRVGACPPVS